MPSSDSSKPPASLTLHSESPFLSWMDEGGRRLRHQDVQALMGESKERFIGILLAETGAEIDEITAAFERRSLSFSAKFNYRMAVVIARLNVLQLNRYILAGAEAFDKLTSLRKQADKMLETHWKGRDPSKAANDRWTELRDWMRSIENLESQLAKHQQTITGQRGRIPAKAELEMTRDALQALIISLPPQILAILDSMPAEAIADGKPLPELADFAVLQQLVCNAGEDIVGRFEALHVLVACPVSMAEHPLMQSAQSTLAQAHELIELHGQHTRSLQQAQIEFHSGNIDKARLLLASLKNFAFADLEYDTLRKSVSRATRLMNQLRTEKRSEAVTHARTLLKRYPGIHIDSQLFQEATHIIERGGWWRIIRYAAAALLVLGGVIAFTVHQKKKGEGDLQPTVRKTQVTQPAASGESHPSIEVSTTLGAQDDPND